MSGSCAGNRARCRRLDSDIADSAAVLLSAMPAEDDPDLESTMPGAALNHGPQPPVVVRVRGQEALPLEIPGYSCEAQIGSGSFGVVLRGKRLSDHAPVAIKVLSSSVVTDLNSVMRFHRELEFAVQLRHTNLVSTYEVGSAVHKAGQRFAFLAMELCDGGTLGDLCRRRGPLPWETALPLVAQALSGLAHMHDAPLALTREDGGVKRATGVLHRDLKPSNILIHRDTVKLADFGIAKALQASGLAQLTESGITMGTLAFLAPEAVDGDRYVRPHSDVWSMGATLYALLTGTGPRDYRPNEPLSRALARPLVPLPLARTSTATRGRGAGRPIPCQGTQRPIRKRG